VRKSVIAPRLEIVICSTRPGRVGLPVGEWFVERATEHGAFELGVTDLLELDLPFLDEAGHPRHGNYELGHTQEWSERVSAADAFVFVMSEYNHGYAAPIKNALDFLHREWSYKPLGFVSYGGPGAGTRAVQLLKPVATDLRLFPVVESVNVAFVEKFIDTGAFRPEPPVASLAARMLDEIARLEEALRDLRAQGPPGLPLSALP
jgi:NAD(P)H-dependent FMN reductase